MPVPSALTLAMAMTPWPVFTLFPINGSFDITTRQAKKMGNTSLVSGYLLVNSGLPWDPGTSKLSWYFHEFSVLPSSSLTALNDWLDSDEDNGSVSSQSDGETDEKVSARLFLDQEDLDGDDFQQQCGLHSYPDEF